MAAYVAKADRRGNCRICGEKGHQQECVAKKYCPVCNTAGQCVGTGDVRKCDGL